MDEDIGWHDFALRNHDAQTGRWVQADPFGQFAAPYAGMGNDPVNLIDPSGGIGIPCPGTSQLSIFFMKAGEAVMKGVDALGKLSPLMSAVVNAARFGTQIYNSSVQFKMIDRQLARSMSMQVGGIEDDPTYWILYNGTQVNIYEGEYGNTGKLVNSFKGTSGIYTRDKDGNMLNDYRNSKYQYKIQKVREGEEDKEIFVGPLPEGDYTIDLSLDPDRQAKLASNGKTIPGSGIEKITYTKNGKEYVRYPDWGWQRARLDASSTVILGGRDGNFYFHNSHKGYTHGCVETQTGLFDFLRSIRKSQTSIKVMIKYKSKNITTNGHTSY